MLQLDGTLITVALPSVAHHFHVGAGVSATLLTAYFAAFALLLLPAGMLVDRFGPRRVAVVGLAVLLSGLVAGALAHGFWQLIPARIVQGAGAGMVSPAALAGAVSGFAPERRGLPLGVWGAAAGVANLVGPLLGGTLTYVFGWRAVWWALVPLGAFAAVAVMVCLPPSRPQAKSGSRTGRLSATVFAASWVAALTFALMIGSFYLVEQYLQDSAGYSALAASSMMAVVALLVIVTAPFAGRLVDTHGERMTALLGILLVGVGLALLGAPGMQLGSAISYAALTPLGLGFGMLFVSTSRAGLNSAPASSHGRVSSVLSLGRLLGAMIGASLAGAATAAGPTASDIQRALLAACATCLIIGVPAAWRLQPTKQTIKSDRLREEQDRLMDLI